MISGRITISREEHADLLRRAGNAEDQAYTERVVAERDAALARVAEADQLVKTHIANLRERAWEHASHRFDGPPSWTGAAECVAMLVAELVEWKRDSNEAWRTLGAIAVVIEEEGHADATMVKEALARVTRERDEAQAETRRVVAVMHEAAGGREGETVPDALRRLVREGDEARDGLFRIASALGMIDGEHGRYVVASVDEMVPAIGRLIEERDRGAEAREELRAVHAALGAHVSEGDLAADVERVRVAFDLRLSLVHTVNRDVAEARGALRALRRSIWSGTLTVPRDALAACDAVLGGWDAAESHSPASRALGLGSSVRVLAVPDGAHSVRVGDVGEVIDLDPEAPEGTLYEVARRQQSGGWLAWWYRADQIERVDAAPPTAMEDALRTHAEADGDTTVWPSFTRIGDEDDGSPA